MKCAKCGLERAAPGSRTGADAGGSAKYAGIAVNVGRIRVQDDSVRFVVLGHSTVRGAAGQSVRNAEFAAATGRIGH